MTLRDLIITPLFLILVYIVAWLLMPLVTNRETRRFFIPALSFKILGALAVGFIYQFYYSGGDTFTYFNLGSSHIWDAFLDSPYRAFELIFGGNEYTATNYQYASRIYTFGDPHSYFVVRVAGLLGIMSFNSYSTIAVWFAVISFTGIWVMYRSLLKLYPGMHWPLAIAILFIPSLVFWGSGLLKDTSIGALGWLTWGTVNLFILRRRTVASVLAIMISAYIIYVVKIYILLCFIPAILFWLMFSYLKNIQSVVQRIILLPIAGVLVGLIGYFSVQILGNTSHRYSLNKFSYTAETTAKWNYYVSQLEEGSGYTLGDANDFSTLGMLQRSPQAVWVALFRPYLWEADNVVMLLSGLENLLLLFLALWALYRSGIRRFLKSLFNDPFVFFSFVFVLGFAFAIGVSTYNFGALMRYKIPLMPYFVSAMFIVAYSNFKKVPYH